MSETEPQAGPVGLQKINAKLFAEAPPGFDYDVLLSIFGRWRLDQGEEIMDLADYAHVDHGPNCLLVSHRWHFGIDLAAGQPGFFVSTRKGLSGSPEARITQVLRLLLEKTNRLCSEPECPGAFSPKCGEIEVVLNDRLLAPNAAATESEWRPALDQVLSRLYDSAPAQVMTEKDRSRRLGWRVHSNAGTGMTVDDLLRRLA